MSNNPATVHIESVDWGDASAVALRKAMSAEMQLRYADRFAAREGVAAVMDVHPDTVAYTAVAYTEDRLPVGHAALRWLGSDLELKRMFVAASHRGQGVSVALLVAIEQEAARLAARRIVLQTGDRQPDAVRLYEKTGYTRISIFTPYESMPFSMCFEKILSAPANPGH